MPPTAGRFSTKFTSVAFVAGDGTSIIAGPGAGDFTHSETNAENANAVRVLDRGVYDTHVETEDLEQTWSITLQLVSQSLTSATLDRILDFINHRAKFASLPSVCPNPDIWAFKVVLTMTKGATTATRTLPMCRGSVAFAEALEGHTLAVSGTNNGRIIDT